MHTVPSPLELGRLDELRCTVRMWVWVLRSYVVVLLATGTYLVLVPSTWLRAGAGCLIVALAFVLVWRTGRATKRMRDAWRPYGVEIEGGTHEVLSEHAGR